MSKFTKFILVITLQITIILSIIIYKVSILTSGTEVLLKIQPVDPRSPLRGDYVTFQYNISSIDSYLIVNRIPNESVKLYGNTVYVSLQKTGKYWTAKNVSFEKPISTRDIFIKGKEIGGINNSTIQVHYGIEEYFIPEGTGQNFNFQNKEIAASVLLDDEGNAVLKQIYIDGQPWP